MMQKKALVLLFLCLTAHTSLSYGESAKQPPPSITDSANDADVVKQYCGVCHKVPPAYLMPKKFWPRAVRAMADLSAKRMGVEFISEQTGTIISNHYVRNSPEFLPILPYQSNNNAPRSFTVLETPQQSTFPLVVNVKSAELGLLSDTELLVSDAERNAVVLLSKVSDSWQQSQLFKTNVPVNTQVVDYDLDGDKDIIIAVLGDFPPSDKLVGQVVLLTQTAPGKFQSSILLQGVGRVTDARAVDLDGDNDLDIAVAIFGGGFVGELAWLENIGNGKHKRHKLLQGSGALNVTPADINNDGKMDLISLIAQEHEVIIAMINQGSGKFKHVRLGQAPHPMFGSTSLKLVDMDGDKDLDLLFTNGDANDLQMDPKPYHGVQWSENKGNLTFTYHDIGRFYGASNAVAGDIDNDGDMDVVASSWHNYWDDNKRQSLIWFENNGKQDFTRHNISNQPRSIVSLELKDVTGDNYLDIIAGSFRMDMMIEMIMAAQQQGAAKNDHTKTSKGDKEDKPVSSKEPLKPGIVIFKSNETAPLISRIEQ
jgi:hypothetical protein